MLQFHTSTGKSFFEIGDLQCHFKAGNSKAPISEDRVLRACTPVNAPPTTQPAKRTELKEVQREHVLNWNRRKFNRLYPTSNPFNRPNSQRNNNVQNGNSVNVNFTVNTKTGEKPPVEKSKGLTVTMSMLAVICISAAVVIVWAIIAVIVIVKRRNRRRRRRRDPMDSDSEEDYPQQEMCSFFSNLTKPRAASQPVIEVHRHSIHCDTLEALPPAYRNQYNYELDEYGEYAPQQITTHIDLSYKPRKKSLGLFR